MAPPRAGSAAAGARFGALVSGVVARLASVVAPLMLVPLLLSYLGTEVYGLWMASASLAAILIVCDLGVGSSLLTQLPPQLSSTGDGGARKVVSGGYALVGAASLLAAGGTFAMWGMGWSHRLVGAPPLVDGISVDAVVSLCLLAFIVTVPLQLINRVLYAQGRPAASNLLQGVCAVAALPAIFAATAVGMGKELVLILALFIGPALYLVVTLYYFWRAPKGQLVSPRWSSVDVDVVSRLVRMGLIFLAITGSSTIATMLDTYIVGTFAGLDAAAAYGVPQRIFAQLGALVVIVNLPLWPANAAALHRGDIRWVRSATRSMVLAAGLCTLTLGLLAASVGRTVLQQWAGPAVILDPDLMLGLAAWWGAQAFFSPLFMVMNAAALLRRQLAGWLLFAALAVPAKILLAASGMVSMLPLVSTVLYLGVLAPIAIGGYRAALRVRELKMEKVHE